MFGSPGVVRITVPEYFWRNVRLYSFMPHVGSASAVQVYSVRRPSAHYLHMPAGLLQLHR